MEDSIEETSSTASIEIVLNRYTAGLLALRKPHDRVLLATNLHELFVRAPGDARELTRV